MYVYNNDDPARLQRPQYKDADGFTFVRTVVSRIS